MEHPFDHSGCIAEFEHIIGEYRLWEVKQLFIEYAKSLDVDLSFQDFEMELMTLPGKYAPPDGALILAVVNGRGAGCVALRKINGDTCEMKRLYVRVPYRGQGIGRQLVYEIIEEAKKLNYKYIRLDTLATMESAQKLYLSLGFCDIEPYTYNPIEGTRFMELKLMD